MALLRQFPASKALLDKAAPFQKTAIERCHRFVVRDVTQGDDFFNRELMASGRMAVRAVCHSRYSYVGQAEPFARPSHRQAEIPPQPLDRKYLQLDGGRTSGKGNWRDDGGPAGGLY